MSELKEQDRAMQDIAHSFRHFATTALQLLNDDSLDLEDRVSQVSNLAGNELNRKRYIRAKLPTIQEDAEQYIRLREELKKVTDDESLLAWNTSMMQTCREITKNCKRRAKATRRKAKRRAIGHLKPSSEII